MTRTHAARRRPLLLSLTSLGAVVGLLGFAGVFATSSDRATTGVNDARSGDLATANPVDLQISTPRLAGFTFVCDGEWSEDLATGVIVSDGMVLGGGIFGGYSNRSDNGRTCLRNHGSVPIDVTVSAIDLVDTELECTPNELTAGDTTCGDDGPGELSNDLQVRVAPLVPGDSVGCETDSSTPTLAALVSTPAPVVSLAPGEERVLCGRAVWAQDDLQSQTDRSAWRFAFDAVETP